MVNSKKKLKDLLLSHSLRFSTLMNHTVLSKKPNEMRCILKIYFKNGQEAGVHSNEHLGFV
jgi:hypothetical protein